MPLYSKSTSPDLLNFSGSYDAFHNITLPFDANIVNTVFQDRKGLMWIGTKRGLLNYNGYNFHIYVYGKNESERNTIQTIIQFNKHYLCLGTDHGLLWFNLRKLTFEHINTVLNKIKAVRSLVIFDQKLWIGTRDDGLYYYDLKSQKVEKAKIRGSKETVIYALEPVKDKLFIGSYENLSYYDTRTKKRTKIPFGKDSRLLVNSLLYDSDAKCVFVGTEGLLYKYNLITHQLTSLPFLKGNVFKTMYLDVNRNLLLGTDAGLYVYNLKNNECRHLVHDVRNTQSLCNNIIWKIFRDNHSNVWLATDHGISIAQMFPWYKQTNLSELSGTGEGNTFTHLFVDSRNEYWFGGENGLLHITYNPKGKHIDWFNTNHVTCHLNHNVIRYIYEDKDKNIWIATDASVARYDRVSNKFIYYNIEGRGGRNANWAYSIYEDESNRLWIATYMGGLFVINKNDLLRRGAKGVYYDTADYFHQKSYLIKTIYQMFPDNKGNIWANTSYGLSAINTKTMEISVKHIYMDNLIYDKGYIWYSDQGRLYKYNTENGTNRLLSFKVSSGSIYSFVKDDSRMWLSSIDGIYYFDINTNQLYPSDMPDNYYLSGVVDRKKNQILWGGLDCITALSLTRLNRKRFTKHVYISSILSNGEELKPGVDYEGENILYNHEIYMKQTKNITFELSSLTYYPTRNETFYYQFNEEGVWHSMKRGQNQLAFAELPNGVNNLYLSNSNPNIDKKAIIDSYLIKVPYPWYETWYAIFLYIMLLVGIVAYIIWYQQKRNQRKYEQKEKEKSLELSRLKMDFFVNISHELKTPLSLIIAPLSKLISEVKNQNQKSELLAIHKNSMRLNTLIYKVLDFKKMEYESENTLIRSHIEINSLLKNCINTFSSTLKERNITIQYTSNESEIWLNLDMLKMESVFINLISNAIKYVADDTGLINISLLKDDKDIIIKVEDNGTGIKEDELQLVFLRFFQGKNAEVKKGGTGIGLYLVKKFIELHSGKVEIESNHGLSIKISLPFKENNPFIEKNLKLENTSMQTNTNNDDMKEKILIIDDNKEIVEFLAKSLSDRYHCIKGYNGKDGINEVQKSIPDLIIVDQMMPEMNGFEFCRYIRHNKPTAAIPIIMLTAKDDMETELESIQIGIDAFMPKPFDMKRMLLQIVQLIKRHQVIKETVNIEQIANHEFKSSTDSKTPDEILIEKIIQVTEENMQDEEFNITTLAKIIGIDNKQLYRKTKQITGLTPVAYVKKLRMKKAAVLLKENKFTVSEVMYLIGYTNASYFTKCFSEEFGKTPKDYLLGFSDKKDK